MHEFLSVIAFLISRLELLLRDPRFSNRLFVQTSVQVRQQWSLMMIGAVPNHNGESFEIKKL